MGHTNSTANLSLPQFIGTDKPTWLGDVNGAFSAIDSYAGTNNAAVAAAVSDASSAIAQASSAVSTANAANTTAGNASTAATNAVGTANNAVAIAGAVDSKVGLLADLTTSDRTSIVNAINEVNAAVGTVPTATQVSYDNTGSGLTATNVQDAIDEVAQGGGGGSSTWSQIGQETGPVSITIPIGLDELLVVITKANNPAYNFTISIPTAFLDSTTKSFRSGEYKSASSYGGCKIDVTSTSLILSDFTDDAGNQTATTVVTVYGK